MQSLLSDPPLVSSDWAERWERRCGPWGTALLIGAMTQVLSFIAFSLTWNPNDFTTGRLGGSIAPMCENPWRTDLIAEPQVRHRLLVPIVAWLLGLRGNAGVAVPLMAICFVGAVVYRLLRDREVPANLAAVTVLLLGTTPVIFTSQVWLGCTDAVGFLGIALCLYYRGIWALGPIMFLAMMGEERAIAAAPLILLWHFTQEETGWVRWRNGLLRGASLVAALILWYAVFHYVKVHFVEPYIAAAPQKVQDAYAWAAKAMRGDVLRQQLLTIPSGVHYAFRAGYLLPILLLMLWWPRRWYEASLALAGFLLGLIPAVLVFDVTRVTAYQYPFLLLAVVHLNRAGSRWTTYAVLGCCLVNYLTPVYMTTGRFHNWIPPLPVTVARFILGI